MSYRSSNKLTTKQGSSILAVGMKQAQLDTMKHKGIIKEEWFNSVIGSGEEYGEDAYTLTTLINNKKIDILSIMIKYDLGGIRIIYHDFMSEGWNREVADVPPIEQTVYEIQQIIKAIANELDTVRFYGVIGFLEINKVIYMDKDGITVRVTDETNNNVNIKYDKWGREMHTYPLDSKFMQIAKEEDKLIAAYDSKKSTSTNKNTSTVKNKSVSSVSNIKTNSNKIRVVSVIKEGRKIKAYQCTNGSKTTTLTKEQLSKLISEKKVENATQQTYHGTLIIRVQ